MNKEKVNPLKLLVEDEIEVETETKSGIILPNQIAKKNTMRGTVVIKGEGTADIHIVHDVGDKVLFNPHAGNKFQYEGKDYRLIDVNEVILGGVI